VAQSKLNNIDGMDVSVLVASRRETSNTNGITASVLVAVCDDSNSIIGTDVNAILVALYGMSII